MFNIVSVSFETKILVERHSNANINLFILLSNCWILLIPWYINFLNLVRWYHIFRTFPTQNIIIFSGDAWYTPKWFFEPDFTLRYKIIYYIIDWSVHDDIVIVILFLNILYILI